MRLFVAVMPPERALAELAAEVAPLRALPGAAELRWAPVDGWHLTLAFLGEVAEERVPALEDGLAQAAAGYRAHRLRLAGGGRFGDRTLWVGLDGETWALHALARAVTQVAGELGCGEGEFSFHPHLTVARSGRHRRRGALREEAAALADFRGAEWEVAEFHLVRSDFTGGRSRYTVLRSWPLAGAEPAARTG
ncbi:RNA 2',3'-cyclic phosphodiesterase [Kitasatospora sp. NPDC052896]|uniref:RNA 2',3'-cyclic phosphodiesterase n=1 Tax=Kitasatospora sp. NPDC052896 TaxID=3364061 RepID=UPI0037C8306F